MVTEPFAAVEVPTVRLSIVVLPIVKSPLTDRLPFTVRFPEVSVKRFVFSIHVYPFQKNIDPVAEPPMIVPVAFDQYVEVPLLTRTCPSAPILLALSYKPPVI